MSKNRFEEPPIDPNYRGIWRKCSCGCGESRPLTKDYFGVLVTREYKYLQYQRRVCRAKKRRDKRNGEKEKKLKSRTSADFESTGNSSPFPVVMEDSGW